MHGLFSFLICKRLLNASPELVDDIFLVSEEEILVAMRLLWERMKIIVEPSGAVPVQRIVEVFFIELLTSLSLSIPLHLFLSNTHTLTHTHAHTQAQRCTSSISLSF